MSSPSPEPTPPFTSPHVPSRHFTSLHVPSRPLTSRLPSPFPLVSPTMILSIGSCPPPPTPHRCPLLSRRSRSGSPFTIWTPPPPSFTGFARPPPPSPPSLLSLSSPSRFTPPRGFSPFSALSILMARRPRGPLLALRPPSSGPGGSPPTAPRRAGQPRPSPPNSPPSLPALLAPSPCLVLSLLPPSLPPFLPEPPLPPPPFPCLHLPPF